MKNGLRISALLFLGSALFGAPCAPGTLQSYTTLATGCAVGSVNFSNFTLVPGQTGATPIDFTAVQVTPAGTASSPGLNFALSNPTATTGQLLELIFRFTAAAPSLTQSTVALLRAGATGDGATTGILNVCAGGSYSGNSPLGCPATDVSALTFAIASDAMLTDATPQFSANILDIFADFVIDGGQTGTASLGSATITTTSTSAVPEPGTALLLIPASLAMLSRLKRKKQN